uniref:F-box domain-containing protein n=1 Tax=Caenorhabditis tropicalis TaxID=1561998 RepID=A0A1I7UTR7_9PELO
MDLLRLPYVPLIEIFKTMDFREKFLISSLSKRAKNIINLTSMKNHFSFEFSNSLDIYLGQYHWYSKVPLLNQPWGNEIKTTAESDYLIGGEIMRLSFSPFGIFLRRQTIRNQLLLAGHVLDEFPKSTLSISFSDRILPTSVLEFINMIHQRKLSMKTFTYNIPKDASVFVPEILDKCAKVADFVSIYCEKLHRTALQKLWLFYIEDSKRQLIIDALNNRRALYEIERNWVKVKRRDDLEFLIYKNGNFLQIQTEWSYLEQLRNNECHLIRRAINNELAKQHRKRRATQCKLKDHNYLSLNI